MVLFLGQILGAQEANAVKVMVDANKPEVFEFKKIMKRELKN